MLHPRASQASESLVRFDLGKFSVKVKLTNSQITIATKIFPSRQLDILPDDPYIFSLNGKEYRGNLRLSLNPDSNSFDVINLVPLEPYLAGVVGAEMPSYWEPAALRAQAIAARTYALYIKKRFGSRRDWDVKKTQAHQAYHGVFAESAQVWDAVNRTIGQVLTCRQQDNTYSIFPTYYSSACGGHTENSANVFGDSFAPLVGVDCPFCKHIAKPTFFNWPEVQFTKKDLTKKLQQKYPKLKDLGQIKEIAIERSSDYDDFSRLTFLKLIGSNGKFDFLRAEDFRLAMDRSGRKIKSTIFKIVDRGDKWAFRAGRGFGHGVGMCQCGSQEMARQSEDAEDILKHYYPNSRIRNVYSHEEF